MNTMYFQDLVRGEYGRKVAEADYEVVTFDNALDIVKEGVTAMNINAPAIKYLWNYYKGDQPIRYRQKIVRDDVVNRIVENHAYELVQFKVSQSYGEPLQCISRKDDDEINQYVDKLNDYLSDAYKNVRDITCGEWQSAVGFGYQAVIDRKIDGAEIPFGIVVPDPINTIVVYSSSTQEPLLAIQRYTDKDKKTVYKCYSETHQFTVINSIIWDWSLHTFGGIPIVEKMNNAQRLSDIEIVIDLFDSVNNLQSNRADSVEQFIQSFMKFINCEIDKEKFQEMKKLGAFMIKSNNGDNKADVDILEQQLDQSQTQITKEDIYNNALSISAMPNKEGNTGGDTQGAVELRNGYNFAKSRAKLKDPYIIEQERKLLKCVLNIIRIRKGEDDLRITTRDFNVQINHSQLDNLLVKCQALQYLLQCGIHPLVALKSCGLFADVEKVFTLSKPYLDKLYIESTEGFNVEEQAKKVDLFVKCLNSGMSIEDASKQSGLEINTNAEGFQKWVY